MISLASRSLLMWYLMWQMSLPRQHGQTDVFLPVHSLPHFFQFVIYALFSPFSCIFFPTLPLQQFLHTLGQFCKTFLVCTYCHNCTDYRGTQDTKPGGQTILLWQTISWVTCSKEWRDGTFKQTVAALALARTHSLSRVYVYDVQTHIYQILYLYVKVCKCKYHILDTLNCEVLK